MIPTLRYQHTSVDERFRFLPPGYTVYGIADACRAASLEFLSGSNAGWSRRELAGWLVGPYGSVVAPFSRRSSTPPPSGIARVPGTVESVRVESLLASVRTAVVQRLIGCRESWTAARFARNMVDGGFVVGVSDEGGAIGYAPLDGRDMRLVDRVTSLVVADYLTRPNDFEHLLVCAGCREVSFSWTLAHREGCEHERRASGTERRRDLGARETCRGAGGSR